MYVNIIDRRNQKNKKILFNDIIPILEIKRIVSSIVSSSDFSYAFISLIAENEQDIEFIHLNFHGIPNGPSCASKAIWIGEVAIFIILNYPTD